MLILNLVTASVILFLINVVDAGRCAVWTKGPCDPDYCEGEDRDCLDIQKRDRDAPSGVYTVCIDRSFPEVRVYCDMVTDGGGWMVFQRRQSGATDFYRDWVSYAKGFGNPDSEFWLGNRLLHAITDCNGPCDVRFDLEDFARVKRYAKYKNFYISGEDDKFRLNFKGYEGDAGNAFARQRGSAFSTKDRDHDTWGGKSCSVIYRGAWWYADCHASNLNGIYHGGKHTSYADGINWYHWHGLHYSLKSTEIKLRCTN